MTRRAAANRAFLSASGIFERCSIVFTVMYSTNSFAVSRPVFRGRFDLFIARRMYHGTSEHARTNTVYQGLDATGVSRC